MFVQVLNFFSLPHSILSGTEIIGKNVLLFLNFASNVISTLTKMYMLLGKTKLKSKLSFFFFFPYCVVHKLSLTEIMLRSGMRTNLLLSYVGGKKILEELPY